MRQPPAKVKNRQIAFVFCFGLPSVWERSTKLRIHRSHSCNFFYRSYSRILAPYCNSSHITKAIAIEWGVKSSLYKCYMKTYPSVLRSPSVFRVWAAIPSEYMALSQTFSVTSHIFSSASNHWIRWTWSLLHLAFWPRHRANLWTSHEGHRNPRDPTLWSQIFRSFVWKIRCRNKKHPKWKTVGGDIGEVDEEWWIHEFFWLNFLFHCLWGHNTLYLEEVWSFDWWKSNPPHRQCGGMIGTDRIGKRFNKCWQGSILWVNYFCCSQCLRKCPWLPLWSSHAVTSRYVAKSDPST